MTPRPLAAGLPSDRWRIWDTALWLPPLIVFFAFPDHLVLGSQIVITALFALSLDLLLGYAGIVSLGHAAFFGLGAYTAGLLAVHGWPEPLTGLAAAAVVAAIAGYATSFLVVRAPQLGQLMITLGVGLILGEIANKESRYTGGVDGMSDIPMSPLLGKFRFDIAGHTGYLYSLAVALAAFLLVRRVVSSPFGLSLRAIRENERRMPAIGADSRARLHMIYTIAAAVAGGAGALLAQTTQFVSLGALSFERSAELVTILVIGGTGRLYGGVIGAIVYLVARDRLSGMNPQYWYFWIGLMLIGVVLFLPSGILGGVTAAARRVFHPQMNADERR